jgi:hypothetical protein
MKPYTLVTKLGDTIIDIAQQFSRQDRPQLGHPWIYEYAHVRFLQADYLEDGAHVPAKNISIYIPNAEAAQHLSSYFGELARALQNKGVEDSEGGTHV